MTALALSPRTTLVSLPRHANRSTTAPKRLSFWKVLLRALASFAA